MNESETKCYESLSKRLIPEGMEWPCFEDGEPVRIGDVFTDCFGGMHTVSRIGLMHATYSLQEEDPQTHELRTVEQRPYGNRVKRVDTWEQLEEGSRKAPFAYCNDTGYSLDSFEDAERYKAQDIVRRAKKLGNGAKTC